MRKYKYTATDQQGRKVKGTFVADNESEMKKLLLKAGYYVTSYHEVAGKDLSSFFSVSGKIKTKELNQFCSQFSVMISAGISIVEAIKTLKEQNFSTLLKSTLNKIDDDLKQGLILSDAMLKYPKVFPPFFANMVFVGESAGCLDRVLITVAEYYETEEKTKKKFKSALAYPIVLIVMLIGIVIIMMGFVIPSFINSFAKMNVEMPALTMAIFNMSLFFQDNWMFILAFVAVFIIIIWALNRLESVKTFSDRLKVTLPISKKINMAIFTSRFARSLGLLLSSGADTLSALETLHKTIDNRFLKKQFSKVINNVKMGMSLSGALNAEMKISPILTQMIIIGERTGELDQVLLKTAPYFDQEAEAALNLITTIIQPVVLGLIAGIIAVLFIAMYSPILGMITNLQTSNY